MSTDMRLRSLDGLRGLAAVVVLVHHALLTFPQLSDAYFDMSGRETVDGAWVLAYTPLHAVWAGVEGVYLFFVLSGIVLTLPVLRAGRSFSWRGYYPRRLVRLYIPVIAAVALGLLLITVAPRSGDPSLGAWFSAVPGAYSLEGVVRDVTLVFGVSGVISPLWSLRWEVFFSLLLPLYVSAVVIMRRAWWLKLAAVVLALIVGSVAENAWLFFLPMFAIGSLLAAEWHAISMTMERLNRRRWFSPVVLVASLLLTTSNWIALGTGLAPESLRFIEWIPVVGVTLLILVGAFWQPAVWLLETKVVLWLGGISFSLYLVHEPIIIASRMLTFPASPWLGVLISVPLAFGVAQLFAKFIEQPTHRLSKRVGRWAENPVRRADRPTSGQSF